MFFKKYSQEVIDGLVNIAASATPIKTPSTHLNRLYRTVAIGMYDSIQSNQSIIRNLEVNEENEEAIKRIEQEAKTLLSTLLMKVITDIEFFEAQSIEYKMSCITKSRLLDVLPSEYNHHEMMFTIDKESAAIEYTHLTRPIRKTFIDKYKTEIQIIDELVNKAKSLTS